MTKSEFKIWIKAILRESTGIRKMNKNGNNPTNYMVQLVEVLNIKSLYTVVSDFNFYTHLNIVDPELSSRLYEEEQIVDSMTDFVMDGYYKDECIDWIN